MFFPTAPSWGKFLQSVLSIFPWVYLDYSSVPVKEVEKGKTSKFNPRADGILIGIVMNLGFKLLKGLKQAKITNASSTVEMLLANIGKHWHWRWYWQKISYIFFSQTI